MNVGRTDGVAARNIKAVYGYPGKETFSYNLKTEEYAIYTSEKEANPEAVIKCALEEIERRERMVSV